MLVEEDKPLIIDPTFRLGSSIIESWAATVCISINGLAIRLVTTIRAIVATRTITKKDRFVLYWTSRSSYVFDPMYFISVISDRFLILYECYY
jgi:hypothetical protein